MANTKPQRVRALKNFWLRDQQIGIGSVLELDLSTATELRSAQKLEFVQADTPMGVVAPPPKKPRPVSDTAAQLSALTEAVTGLTALVQAMVSDKGGKRGG